MTGTRQLDMFNRRLRGRKPPPTPEYSIHCTIADACKWFLHPQWECTHLPFGEHRDHRINPKSGKRYSPTGTRLKRMGVKPGWPDFMFMGPERAMFWLELKRSRGGRMNPDQARIAAHIVACGFPFLCTGDPDDAIATLRDYGILTLERRRVPYVPQERSEDERF